VRQSYPSDGIDDVLAVIEMYASRLVAVAALLATLALGTGCGDGKQSSASRTPPGSATPTAQQGQPTATPTPVPSPSPAATSPAGASPATASSVDPNVLQDGRQPARIERVDAARRRITVDVVQFLVGAEASRAAAEDHAPEVPPPNDYWIRNTNPKLRTLPVAAGAPVTVNVHGAPVSGDSTKDIPRTLAQLAVIPSLDSGLFWLTVRNGVVTRIQEQYLP